MLAMNPRGRLPVLRDGDYVVFESLAVLYYLDRKYPDVPLFGRTAEEAAVIMRVINEFQAYTEARLMTITHDRVSGDTETFGVNQPSPEGYIVNDLTLGEYDVVISSVPQRETIEDSQFEQAMALKEAGVQIPDDVLIASSRLINKKDILQGIKAATQSPEAQQQQQLQMQTMQAELDKLRAEAASKAADSELRKAKTQSEVVKAQKAAATPPEDNGAAAKQQEVAATIQLEDRKFEHQKELDYAELQHKIQLENMKAQQDAKLKADQAATDRATRIQQAAQQAQTPKPTPKGSMR